MDKITKEKFFWTIKNFMGNLVMVKFPLHAELQNSWADQTLMSKFTTTVDKNDMDKFPFHSEWQKYEQSPIPSAIAKDMGRFPFHAHAVAKLMGNLPFSNYYRQYNPNYIK